MNMSATKQDRMQLDNLKWETSTEYNYGVDVSTFGGRLRLHLITTANISKICYRRNINCLQAQVSGL